MSRKLRTIVVRNRRRHELQAQGLAVGERVVHKTFPPITRHTLALYCGASGDHNPIHVDLDFASTAGFPDVFSHGMLVMAYLGQALTDAVSPATSVRSRRALPRSRNSAPG